MSTDGAMIGGERQPGSDDSESTRQSGNQDDTVVVGATAVVDQDPVEGGTSLGRYVVLEEVGRGGMGRVLRAYDPRLQREIALKEVRGAALGREGAERLVAEARAMARLSHPNVVAVYDVESIDGRLVLAMEYVAGDTLRTWLGSESRSWREITRPFAAAGRGLAAAHAAGLLHRDFKPANVLVASDLVKVTDFGLAKRAGTSASGWVDGEPSGDDAEDEDADDLTEAGAILGTPRYMAPEQHAGRPLSAAADQYAFCVALWEALAGEPPFSVPPGSLSPSTALAAAKRRGPPAWPGGPTPRPIVDALRRGLATDPGDRWPSMDALLLALAHDPARRRRRWLLAAFGVGAIGLGTTSWETLTGDRNGRCTGARAQLASAWGEKRRAEVHDAVLSIGASYAADVWTRTAAALDAYADGWATMYTAACEAATVRGEQSTAVMDLRISCLHRAEVELEAVTAVLADADATVVEDAHELIAGLRPLSRCEDLDALRADVEPPLPADAAAVEAARSHLAAAEAARKAGRYPEARREVEAAEAALAEAEYRPARAEVAVVEGMVLDNLADFPAAEDALKRGMRLAAAERQPDQLEKAATSLLYLVGYEQQHVSEGLEYGDIALGLAAGDPEREANVRNSIAAVLATGGRKAEAEAEHRRALALWEEAVGVDHPDTASAHNNLAVVLDEQGRYAEAEAEHRRALAIWEKALGPDHPSVAASRNNLAVVLDEQGRYAEAEAEYRGALAIQEKALGPDHPHVAMSRNNLALALRAQGKLEEAAAEQRRALGIWEKALGSDHPDVAEVRTNLAETLLELDDVDAARELAAAAWARRQADDVPPADRAHTAYVLAEALWGSGGADGRRRARALAEQALADYEAADGADGERPRRLREWLEEHGVR